MTVNCDVYERLESYYNIRKQARMRQYEIGLIVHYHLNREKGYH